MKSVCSRINYAPPSLLLEDVSWRAALAHWHNEGYLPQPREIKQMIQIAETLGLSDDVLLLPHLKSLASAENVVAINPRR